TRREADDATHVTIRSPLSAAAWTTGRSRNRVKREAGNANEDTRLRPLSLGLAPGDIGRKPRRLRLHDEPAPLLPNHFIGLIRVTRPLRWLLAGAWDWNHFEEASANALQRLGHTVVPFRWSPFFEGLVGRAERKWTIVGPATRRMNA